jgi:putative spermidine/putrescine transport system permease protein
VFYRSPFFWSVSAPPLLAVLVCFVIPLLLLFYISFMTPSDTQLFGNHATLSNYVQAMTDSYILLTVRRTLAVTAAVLGACLVLGYPVALVVARMAPRRRLIAMMALLFPLMISNVVRAYGWLAILGRDGVLNVILVKLGLVSAPLRIVDTFQAVVIGLVTILLPYMIISIANSLAAIDRSLHEAAESLGAGPLRTFWHVTWPLSSPGVAAGLLLVFFLSLSAYVTIALLGGSRYKLLVSAVFDAVGTLQWPQAASLSFILLVVALVCGALIQLVLRPQRVQGSGR